MADKKNILTYEGLKRYEDELQNLKVVKRKEVAQKIKEGSRGTYLRTRSMMLRKTSREISSFVSRSLRSCLRTQKSL